MTLDVNSLRLTEVDKMIGQDTFFRGLRDTGRDSYTLDEMETYMLSLQLAKSLWGFVDWLKDTHDDCECSIASLVEEPLKSAGVTRPK